MSYIGFLVHWFAEHTQKSAICQLTKLAGLTVRNLKKGVKLFQDALSKSTARYKI